MYEYYNKYFSAKDFLRKNLGTFTESFINHYGEQDREFIEQKFSNALIYAFVDPLDMNEILLEIYGDKDLELSLAFLKKVGITVPEENDLLYLYVNLDNISSLMKLYEGELLESDDISNVAVLIQEIYHDNKTIVFEDLLEKHHIMDRKNVFLSHKKDLELAIQELEEYKAPYKDQEDDIDRHIEMQNQIYLKYAIRLIEEFNFLLTEKEQAYLNELKSKKEITMADVVGHFEDITGSTIDLCGNIESFAPDLVEKLKSQQMSDEQIAQLQLFQIQYFRNHGFDYEYNYEKYLNDENCQRITPSPEIISQLSHRRDELFISAILEYYQHTDIYRDLQREMTEKGIETSQDIAYIMKEGITGVVGAIQKKDDETILYPIVLINLYPIIGREDDCICHELNHLLEDNLLSYDGYNIVMKSGWEIIDDHPDACDERPRESINEFFNERVASDIAKEMKDAGIYVFTDPNYINGPVLRDRCFFPIIDPFYHSFERKIISSKRAATFQETDALFGQENLDALTEVCNDAIKYFPDALPFQYALEANASGIQNEETELAQGLINRSTTIYQKVLKRQQKQATNNKSYIKK